MAAPYTIRIFVADGDPEGSGSSTASTGLVRVCSSRVRSGMRSAGGRSSGSPGSTSCSEMRHRRMSCPLPISARETASATASTRTTGPRTSGRGGSWGIAFVSANRGLNKAHVQWLEFALVEQAQRAGRCTLDNGNVPTAPDLTELRARQPTSGGFSTRSSRSFRSSGCGCSRYLPPWLRQPPRRARPSRPGRRRPRTTPSWSQHRKMGSTKSSCVRAAGTRSGSAAGRCRRSGGSLPIKAHRSPPSPTTRDA